MWLAWQFYRPEQGEGILQFFRRDQSPDAVHTFPLHGLDPVATYELTDLSDGTAEIVSGKDLLEPGLRVEIDARRASRLLHLEKGEPS